MLHRAGKMTDVAGLEMKLGFGVGLETIYFAGRGLGLNSLWSQSCLVLDGRLSQSPKIVLAITKSTHNAIKVISIDYSFT